MEYPNSWMLYNRTAKKNDELGVAHKLEMPLIYFPCHTVWVSSKSQWFTTKMIRRTG
jgi:hypothetical protein